MGGSSSLGSLYLEYELLRDPDRSLIGRFVDRLCRSVLSSLLGGGGGGGGRGGGFGNIFWFSG